MSLVLWAMSLILLGLSMKSLWIEVQELGGFQGIQKKKTDLRRILHLLRDLEDQLSSGLVPSPEQWSELKTLPDPWGRFSYDSIYELRNAGASVVPTIRRLGNLVEEHLAALLDAQAKSAQAVAQSVACALLIPVLGFALYYLLPGVQSSPKLWSFSCLMAGILTTISAIWLFQMTERARWAGLPVHQRPWVLLAQCGVERLLAQIRCGIPPDIAWVKMTEFLQTLDQSLTGVWGSSIWEEPFKEVYNPAAVAIRQLGYQIKKAIQVSLMEGRPCTDRIEAALSAMKVEMKSLVDRQLTLLATQALKPLFTCIAPAILGLLITGFWLSANETLGQAGF